MKKYIVETRYEHFTRNGKEFTQWFKSTTSGKFNTKKKTKNHIKILKANSVNPKMKLKDEYRIVEIESE